MFFQKKEVVLTGKNIFYDKRNRTIFYNRRNQIGYVIPSGSESSFQTLKFRYALGVIGFVFTYLLFHVDLFISIAVGAVIFVVLEYRFRKLLDSFTQISRFDYENSKKSIDAPTTYSRSALLLRIVLYVALAILIIVNLFVSEKLLDDMVIVVFSVAISAFSLYMSYRYVTMLMNQKKVL